MSRWDVNSVLDALSGEVSELERVRTQILSKRSTGKVLLILVVVITLCVGGIGNGLAREIWPFFVAVVGGLIALGIIHYCYFSKGQQEYRALFKHRFLRKIIQHVEPELDYEPTRGIALEEFNASGLYGTRPDRYSGEDLFHGYIGETLLTFSEIHAQEKKTRRDSKGRRKTYWVTIFRGLMVIADFHKEFRSPVSVMPDVAEKHFGWFGKKLQKLGGGLQRMENPEFEELFVVRGKDPVETRYLLTPKMQQALVDLRKRTSEGLRVGFSQSRVWIAIPNKHNWFEPDLHRSAADQGQLRLLLSQLRSCTQIVEELDLNTRIWTK